MLTFKDGREVFRDSAGSETLELLIAGDCCPRNECEKLVLAGKAKEIIADIKSVLDDCDLSVVQFETPLSDNGEAIYKAGPNIRVSPKCVAFIKECGFDIAALANNHIGDYGPVPVMDTLKVLDDNGIKHLGAGKNLAAAGKPLFVEKNGLRLAFLNYAEHEFGIATKTAPGASALDPCVNISQIREVSQKADVTLVIVHGGNEFNPVPSPRMRKTYRAFAEAGAAAVINIHTHCPQGIERWKGVPIIYSLGNFYFDMSGGDHCFNTMWPVGYMIKFFIDSQGLYGFKIFPQYIEYDAGRISAFKGEKLERFYAYMAEISALLADDDKIEQFYDAWAAGSHYWPPRYFKEFADMAAFSKPPREIPISPAARNILTCEAHNEMLTRLFSLYLDGKLEAAKALIPELARLRCPCAQGLLERYNPPAKAK